MTEEDFVVQFYAGKKQGWVSYDQTFVDETIRCQVEEGADEISSWLYLAQWDASYNIYLYLNENDQWEGCQENLESGTERKVRAHWTLATVAGSTRGGDQWGIY